MRVTIRADATREIGTGHAMRCWALAEEFAARGASVTWQSTIDVPWLSEALRQKNWWVSEPQGTELDQALATDADLVVVDSYTIDHSYQQALLDRGTYVVAVVDDSIANAGPADLWVNPGAPSCLAVERESAFLNGPQYVLIREQVRGLRAIREQAEIEGAGLTGITFLLGGTDFANFSRVISTMSQQFSFSHHVYAGPAKEFQETNGITWLSAGPALVDRAARSKLVVSAAGVSSWELAHIGVPVALFQAADNQAGNYDWMTGQGWAWPLGSAHADINVMKLADRISHVLDTIDGGQFVSTSRVDGLGAQRIVDRCLASWQRKAN